MDALKEEANQEQLFFFSLPKIHVMVLHLYSVMVLHLYSVFSMWIYSNALYNTLWGTFAGLLYGAVHNLFLM